MNELQRKKNQLSDLHERHQREFIELFRELKELMKTLARTCEHDFQYLHGLNECIHCGIEKEYYRNRAWE
tara:strand:+ start:2867 stop:3076 length:210 start_codon:yes stop_codon:yes gene_type:complete